MTPIVSESTEQIRVRTSPYQIFMLGLCIYALGALAVQTLVTLDPATLEILDLVDIAVCGVFMLDFIRNVVTAESRSAYLLRWGWLDLLSSIPAIDVFRWGRAARAFRILRVLRGLRATRVLSTFALERRAESAFWGVVLVAILVVVFGSIAILHLERPAHGNIETASDALWWAFVTVTTVGYGDRYPVTSAGRALAAVLMLTGIGLFGTLTAYLASAFIAPNEAQQEREIDGLREEIRLLRDEFRERRG